MNLLKVCKQLAWGSSCTVAQTPSAYPRRALGLPVPRRPQSEQSMAAGDQRRSGKQAIPYCFTRLRATMRPARCLGYKTEGAVTLGEARGTPLA